MERSAFTAFVKLEEVFSTNHRGRREVRYYLKRRDGTSVLAVVGKQKNLGHDMKPLPSSSLYPKKKKHYEAYTRSGVRISVHDFVYVLAEEGKRLVAYLEDLYEDSRGDKMAVVRWFHKVDEVGLDLPHTSYNDKEILFSLCLQDLSIECIDGLATVLSPHHYDNFFKVDAPHTKLYPFVCRNQFDNEVVKPFDITQVKGYWKQNVHRFMSLTTSNGCPKAQPTDPDAVGIRPRKKLRRLVDTDVPPTISENASMQKHQYTIGSEIEVLSQDSGIRGMWFRAVVIKKHKDKLKVRYQDIKDADDESINLEEWILSSRVAAPDHLGIRHCGRMTIRPCRLCKNSDVSFVDVGCIVDAWLHDGWWEGIVIHKESDDKIHVYFPGEKRRSIFGCKDLRYSEEWLGDRWKQMKSRPDLIGSISCATETDSQTTKSHDNVSSLSSGPKGDSLENSDVGRDFKVVDHEVFLTHLNWKWSAKKRNGRNPTHRLQNDGSNANKLAVVETRERDRVPMVRVNRVKVKFTCESSLFRTSVASPLTSLAMSR